MKSFLGFGFLGGVCLFLGCGGIAIFDDAGGSGGDGGTGARPSDDVVAVGPTGTGGASGLSIGLGWRSISANCQPKVPEDPMKLAYDISYFNDSGTTLTPVVLQSRLIIADGVDTLTWSFAVNQSGPGTLEPGTQITQGYEKISDSGFGPRHPCELCDGSATLEVDVAVGGTVVTVSDTDLDGTPATPGCAF